jgi:hypothetical protein
MDQKGGKAGVTWEGLRVPRESGQEADGLCRVRRESGQETDGLCRASHTNGNGWVMLGYAKPMHQVSWHMGGGR